MPDTIAQIRSSVDSLTEQFDIITHNLANVSTAGYKRRCTVFSRLLDSQLRNSATGSNGEVALDGALDFSQGDIVETGRRLDFAIYGKGFFVVETPGGQLYTRNGVFHINQNGQIVDSDGRIIAGQAGPIVIPSTIGVSQIHVSTDGTVIVDGTVIGSFRLVDFGDNEDKLVSAGANCFQVPEDIQPAVAENVVVKQAYKEASNVKMMDELVNMITVSRLYEANMNFVSAQKEASDSIMEVAMG